jgi:hypothetical protein
MRKHGSMTADIRHAFRTSRAVLLGIAALTLVMVRLRVGCRPGEARPDQVEAR